MNVLQLSGEYFDDIGKGVGSYTYNLSRNLTYLGHKVDIVAYVHGNIRAKIPGSIIYNVPFRKTPYFNFFSWGLDASKLIQTISKKYDLIHLHLPGCLSYPFFDRCNIPLVVTTHTTYFDPIHPKWRKPYIFMRDFLSLKKAKYIITVSQAIKDEVIRMGINPEKIVRVPVGADLDTFHPRKEKKNKKIFTPQNNNDTLVFLFVGSIKKRKGIEFLLEAIKRLPKKINNKTFFAIVGNGPLLNYTRTKYSELRNVHFYGFISNDLLSSFYHNADLFIFPSLYEGLPTVVLEAMSSGLPIITTNIPSLRNFIKSDFGILVEPGNVNEISKAIEHIYNNKDMLNYMSQQSLYHVYKYDWKNVAIKISQIYEKALRM